MEIQVRHKLGYFEFGPFTRLILGVLAGYT